MSRGLKRVDSSAKGSNYSISSTSFVALDSTNLSIDLPGCAVGDELEFDLEFRLAAGSNEYLYVDFAVNGSTVSGKSEGFYQANVWSFSSVDHSHLVRGWATVTSPMVATSSTLQLRPYVKISGSTRTIYYNTPPVIFVAKNLGPQSGS
jgi:hypothetical protein